MNATICPKQHFCASRSLISSTCLKTFDYIIQNVYHLNTYIPTHQNIYIILHPLTDLLLSPSPPPIELCSRLWSIAIPTRGGQSGTSHLLLRRRIVYRIHLRFCHRIPHRRTSSPLLSGFRLSFSTLSFFSRLLSSAPPHPFLLLSQNPHPPMFSP